MKQRVFRKQVPAQPQNLRLRHGPARGEVLGRVTPNRDGKVRFYEGQWTFDPTGTEWSARFMFSNSRSLRLEGLPRGRDIWVRVRARNPYGGSAWSDPATIMVI